MSINNVPPSDRRRPLRVLLVDDSPFSRGFHKVVLAAAGYDCSEAANGADALDQIIGESIDLVVTDLEMPVLDGFKLLAALSLLPKKRRPAAIVISAEIDAEAVNRWPTLRLAHGLLSKPADPRALLELAASAPALKTPFEC
ncbi:MAG: response regulator [Hyphomonadaceae bacterium]